MAIAARLRTLAALLCLFLSACATCERHPAVCAVAATVIVGTAIAVAEARHGGHNAPIPHCQQQPTPLDCRPIMGGP